MGALTAYVHVRLCCSLCHRGRHVHRSLPCTNRWIYGCTLPAGTKRRWKGWRKDGEIRAAEATERWKRSEMRTRNRNDDWKDETNQRKCSFMRKGVKKRKRGGVWQFRQTGRRRFQPSTHQSAQLFRCLLGDTCRRTDCSQWYVLGIISETS